MDRVGVRLSEIAMNSPESTPDVRNTALSAESVAPCDLFIGPTEDSPCIDCGQPLAVFCPLCGGRTGYGNGYRYCLIARCGWTFDLMTNERTDAYGHPVESELTDGRVSPDSDQTDGLEG
jgi:hypothetical protein